jgi:prevent-host-death family protein
MGHNGEITMAKRMSAAQAKAQFSSLLAEVAHSGQHIIIERRGKPFAALVSVEDLEQLEQYRASSAKPQGALALVGAWREMGDAELDAIIDEIYVQRAKDMGRPVELED